MSAKTSFLLLIGIGALPILAAFGGLYRLITAPSEEHLSPIADLCQIAYRKTLDTSGHIALTLLAVMLVFIGLRIVLVLVSSRRRTADILRLNRVAEGSEAALRCERARLRAASPPIDVVETGQVLAITVGLREPRIVLSSSMVQLLSDDELEAVIRHEMAHVVRRDPLRSVLADCVRLALPFVPVVGYIAAHFRAQREIEADRSVVRAMGSPASLASALLKTIAATPSLRDYQPGISPTEARIDMLLGRTGQGRSVVATAIPAVISVLIVGSATIAVFAVAAHPDTVTLHIC